MGDATGATGNEVVANTTDHNSVGIHLFGGATANTIQRNAAVGNTKFDLEDDNPGCDSNDWSDNIFDTSNNPSCIH